MRKFIAVLALLLSTLAARADISVSGDGKVTVVPNLAQLMLSLNSEGPTASDALDANNAAMKLLLKKLAGFGIADKDVKTTGFNVAPKYKHETGKDPVLVGYVVSHSLTVKVRKIDDTGKVVDALVNYGLQEDNGVFGCLPPELDATPAPVLRVDGVTFTLDDETKALDEARKAAVIDARRKAELYAAAAGVSVGKVLNISEVTVNWAPRMWSEQEIKAAAADGVPFSKGEQQVSATITVVFAIADAK
jgi:uncharacterized protein YggE